MSGDCATPLQASHQTSQKAQGEIIVDSASIEISEISNQKRETTFPPRPKSPLGK
jgi:hypothetical protein